MGGDGMSGYSLYGREYIGLRGYENGSLTNAGSSFIAPNASDASLYSKLTMELRYPISLAQSATIYALAFMEAGNSWYELKDFEPFNLYRSAGVGLRVFLPMFGLLGIDWGYGFDSVPGRPGAAGSQIHFVLGQSDKPEQNPCNRLDKGVQTPLYANPFDCPLHQGHYYLNHNRTGDDN